MSSGVPALPSSAAARRHRHDQEVQAAIPPAGAIEATLLCVDLADHMAGYEQQDAHEFMIALLDGIETI